MILPSDDFILLSLINTKLRDEYSSLQELCAVEDVGLAVLQERLSLAGYVYDADGNSFKPQR